MASLFLFAQQLNDEGCYCLSLDDNGQVLAEPMRRTFAQILQLQQDNGKTVVIIPTTRASLHTVELPWLGEKKARAALPYALEDQLAQTVDSLHFAFDRQHYANGRYLIAVSDKTYIAELVAILKGQAILFDAITIDWFALHDNECCLLPDYALINHAQFNGALSQELLELFLSKSPQPKPQYYRFSDSFNVNSIVDSNNLTEPSALWIAQRLHQGAFINLAQGSLASSKSSDRNYWYLAAGMAAICLLTLIMGNVFKVHQLNRRLLDIDHQIAVIYRQFFPQAQQVISPRFRIGQLLKSNQGQDDRLLWVLLNTLAQANQKAGSAVERLSFQSNTLQATLVSDDFAALENLQNELSQSNIKVKQTQASTRDGKVVSTLELNL